MQATACIVAKETSILVTFRARKEDPEEERKEVTRACQVVASKELEAVVYTRKRHIHNIAELRVARLSVQPIQCR
jgi:predicted Zn-ribbon and HTH transcriptional regulator